MNEDDRKDFLKNIYREFNNRNLPVLLNALHPEVIWPNGMEGGYVYGHQGVSEYWTRQWTMINASVDPVSFKKEPDGRILVKVHQVVKDLIGNILQDRMVEHVYSFQEDLIIGMEIRDS